jgi:hypothetical protein
MGGLKKSDSIDGAAAFRYCHCEPTARANAPRLREAIHRAA